MSATAWLQFGVFTVVLLGSAALLGRYFARVFSDDDSGAPGDKIFAPVERVIFRVCRVNREREQRWNVYALSVLAFSAASFVLLYLIQRLQGHLPFNPEGMPAVAPSIAFNTSTSFVANTNWQAYGGETTMSYFTQMAGLAVQNFVSAAVGLAVMVALIRGLARRSGRTIGNFWADLTRAIVRVLLPLSVIVSLALASQGIVQNLAGYVKAHTVEGFEQVIPGGPAASQVAIKHLGTNGGGFFNANSAYPFENSNGFTDFIEIWALLVIPFAVAFAFGRMVKDKRQGRAVVAIMAVIWGVMSFGAMQFESAGNPKVDDYAVSQSATGDQSGGWMEGKETRYGPASSGLFAASTTGTSTGSVNAMHDSFTPLGGGITMLHMMFGEVSPGGVGVGLNGLLVLAILSVFIAGLMVGRTPEYLGKKIQATEIKLVMIYLLVVPTLILGFSAVSAVLDNALASRTNTGPHGLSEILYAYTSGANNNGSAFGGLDATTDWYTTTIGIAMLAGRFLLVVAVLAIAGSLVRKRVVPESPGTLPTHTPLFGGMVIGVVVIVAGLTYVPALALGPILEQLSI